jgi:hypothetical protein
MSTNPAARAAADSGGTPSAPAALRGLGCARDGATEGDATEGGATADDLDCGGAAGSRLDVHAVSASATNAVTAQARRIAASVPYAR